VARSSVLSRLFLHRTAWLALAAGGLHALSFAPGPLPGWLLPIWQLATLATLVFLCERQQEREKQTTLNDSPLPQAGEGARAIRGIARLGWCFGLTHFGVGLYWLYISMHTYGHLAAPLAAAAVVVLAAALAVFPMFACALAAWLAPRNGTANITGRALVWAACWTLAEWLRGTLFTGLPWLNVGYAHIDGPYAGWAALAGVYGVAFLAAFAAAAAGVVGAAWWQRQQGRGAQPLSARVLGCALGCALLGLGLGQIEWSVPHGAPLEVRLVQGNIDQGEKFNPAQLRAAIDQHLQQAALPPMAGVPAPALIVLPETVMPVFQQQVPGEVWQAWRDLAAQQAGRTIVMGAPLYESDAGRARYTNSVIGITADTSLAALQSGQLALRYDKHHLVPFGEFVPAGFRWLVDAMQIPLGDFDRGAARQAPFAVADQTIAPNICFEDVFGEELLPALHPDDAGNAGATILVNLSNLGWFGDSWALRQHLWIARMRARETARPMLRATNTGMTAAIAPDGRVLIAAEPLQARVIGLPVQGMTGLTPYARWGNTPVLMLMALCLGAAAARRKV